ncbi:MAG: hypothetical protein O3B21_14765 [Proteobacteria bacterium]|nr:hypothetical protein [Pseudomonadota bacterium]MDA1357775.1 hypothetical protein [Pseudomonadota bacterium]
MRTYGRIETSFWQNPKVRALSCDESRHLLLYLYSCPHGNSLGCFVLPDGYIMADLNWPAETLALRFSELTAKRFIERDPNNYLVRIAGWFGHNKIENRNVALGAMKIIAALPRGSIFDNLLADLEAIDNKFLMPLLCASGSHRERVPKRSESPEPEPEPEPKPEPEEEAALSARARPPAPPPVPVNGLMRTAVTARQRQATDQKGARLARDWAPAPDAIAFAAAAGLAPAAIAAEAAKFRDYWIAIPGARGCKLDWPATWKNWIRRTAEQQPGRAPGWRSDALRDPLANWGEDENAKEPRTSSQVRAAGTAGKVDHANH